MRVLLCGFAMTGKDTAAALRIVSRGAFAFAGQRPSSASTVAPPSAGKISRQAIATLFRNESNPIEVIKWKDIYENLEMAIDKCEDAANIIESVVLKNA